MTATFLQNMKDVQDCHNQIDRVKDELARSKSKWAAADRVRCKAAASACKARLKRAEQIAKERDISKVEATESLLKQVLEARQGH